MASHITMSKTKLFFYNFSLFFASFEMKFLNMSTLNTQIGQNDIISKKIIIGYISY